MPRPLNSQTLPPYLEAADEAFVEPRLKALPCLLCVLSVIYLKYLSCNRLYVSDFALRVAGILSPEEGHRGCKDASKFVADTVDRNQYLCS